MTVTLFLAHRSVNYRRIKFGRIGLLGSTLILFLSVLGDNHIFSGSTLPQLIELHMTYAARAKHSKSDPGSDHISKFGTTNYTAIAGNIRNNLEGLDGYEGTL